MMSVLQKKTSCCFASDYLKDEYLSDEKAEKKKQKFLIDATNILEELRETATQSSM